MRSTRSILVADKQLRANRQGNLYLHLELSDKSGSVGARLWNASEGLARTFEPGDFLHVRGKIQVFQGALQVILSHIEGVARDQVEPEDFLPQSSQNVARLTARLRELLFGLRNPHLRALAECFLIDEGLLHAVHHRPGRDQEPPRLSGRAPRTRRHDDRTWPTGSATSTPTSTATS